MEEVNEKTTSFVMLTFKNEDGVAVTPDSLTYRLDDEASGEELIEDTVVVPSSTSYTVTIPSATNTILNDDKKFEIKIFTASFTFSTTKVGTAEYKYKLLNLKYLE
jgi:hypothetical protein